MRALSRTLLLEAVGPLVVFYGLRALGVDQFVALLAGGVLPLVNAIRGIVTRRRVSGVTAFVLATMVLTVAMSFVVGSPRLLLLRNGWGVAALGIWILVTLLARRPFLYEAARLVFDEEKQVVWQRNWERYPEFRRMLRVASAVWGVAFLVDAGVRVVLALRLPVDAVPVLDDVLLVVTLVLLMLFVRVSGRAYLRRNGLRIRGVQVSAVRANGELVT